MPKSYTISAPDAESGMSARWLGIDQRNTQVGANPSTLYDAVNVDITIGGELRRRDGLEEYAKLPPGTLGLYSLGGYLRVVGPAGNGLRAAMPSPIQLDEFGDSDIEVTPLDRYVKVGSDTNWGASFELGPQPYFTLQTAGGQVIHHWINKFPAGIYDPVDTRVSTPFASGLDLVKLGGKIIAFDTFTGKVHFSSTEFGPSKWNEVDAPGDAGFISPETHALSEVSIRGIGQHQGRLMVVYDNAIQFWTTDPDPANYAFVTAYNGPGTRQFGSLENVIGDVYYFSDGGFRSLATQTVTGELREGDIGSPIEPITRAFRSVDADSVRSIWSQARSQYICVFNNTDGSSDVFAFTSLPSSGVQGWTRWTLPVSVDDITEHKGELFVRNNDTIFRFNPDVVQDEVSGAGFDVEADVITQFLTAGNARRPKQWLIIDIKQEGSCDISMLIDQRDRSIEEPIAYGIEGTTYDMGAIPIQTFAHSVAFRFKARGLWELDGLAADVQLLDGMG